MSAHFFLPHLRERKIGKSGKAEGVYMLINIDSLMSWAGLCQKTLNSIKKYVSSNSHLV